MSDDSGVARGTASPYLDLLRERVVVFGDYDVDGITATALLTRALRIVGLDIITPRIMGQTVAEKHVVLDIRAHDITSRRFNIEVQVASFSDYAQRILYYWAGMYHGQIQMGQGYGRLQPAYAIHITGFKSKQMLAAPLLQGPAKELVGVLQLINQHVDGRFDKVAEEGLEALTATLAYSLEPDVSLTPYRDQARQIYDGCLQLQDSISALKPPIILYPVTTAMPLTQVAVALYGKDAKAKVPELRSLNRIAVPYWIPQGTILKAVAPVVRQ